MKKIAVILSLFIFTTVYANDRIPVTLNKCVDGDTAWFNLNNERIKARFLAIDTRESTNKVEPYGKEASDYTCNELSTATKIEIEYDEKATKFDKYNRHLVWVFVDDELLQKKIIENGLGEVKYLYGDYKYNDLLKFEEQVAKGKKIGLWSDDDNQSSYIAIIICIILCLLIPSYRKKIKRKGKNKLNKYLKV